MENIVKCDEKFSRNRGGWWLVLAVLALIAALLPSGMLGEDAAPGSGARAVRLSSVDGTVRLSQGSQVLADPAVANVPLFEGTQVVTGDDGRAEVQFEDGSVARISPNSSLTLTVLRGQGGSGEAEIALDAGLGYFELQGGAQNGTIRVRFADAAVTASGYTVVRVSLDNPPGELAVFSGNAHIDRGNALSLDLHGGESVSLNGADAGRYTLQESIEPDSWDTWNSDRDQVLTSAAADRTPATNSFADSNNPAWSDLDSNGNWYNVPGQGYIWSPYEAANTGWDPYGSGYWMYTPRFGYIWASGNSWGYLPYQCGNWNWFDSFGWGWAPGMGGCNPWWGAGFYGGPYIGSGYGGYRPPMRPRRPRPFGGGGNRPVFPMVAVNRHVNPGSTELPARDRTTVVSIAGHTLEPLHPVISRPQYERTASGPGSHGAYPGVGTGASSGVVHGGPTTYNGARATGPAPARSSSGSQHATAAAPAHASPSGGSAGGGGHPSGGGGSAGGGGGGASHASGGGGGGGGGGGHH